MTTLMFFSFDGVDGAGKSTQITRFCDWLRAQGCDVITCRDPGSTPLGEQVRRILLASDESTPIGARSEMLLYMAARTQLVEETIRPALCAGKSVVSDTVTVIIQIGNDSWSETVMMKVPPNHWAYHK